jgi:hypothetical protein
MRKRIGTAFAAFTVLAIWAGTCSADPTDDARAPAPTLSADQKAINACVTAFISKVLPSDESHVQIAIPSGRPTVFAAQDARDRESTKVMQLTMTAYSSGAGTQLAKAQCTVSAGARVLDLSAVALDPSRLAHLTAKDLKFTFTKGS